MFGDAATPYLEPYGGDYFAFVLIGIAFSGYFGVGLNSFASRLREAQTTGTLEAMLNSPVRFSTIIISSVQWDYFMTTLRVFVYILVGGLFLGVRYQIGQFGVALLILLLTVVNFASLGILAASFIMVLKRGNPITWLFGTTSTLLGGVYYPITVLPNWLQILSKLLPVTYALRAMRQTLLPGADMSSVWQDIAVLFGFGVIFIPLSLWAFRFAVRQARIDGSLTHY